MSPRLRVDGWRRMVGKEGEMGDFQGTWEGRRQTPARADTAGSEQGRQVDRRVGSKCLRASPVV